MKILSFGLDNSLLEKNSHLARRVVGYGEIVDKYIVLVPTPKDEEKVLSNKVKVYGVGGRGKILKFLRVFNLAKKLLQGEDYDLITVQDQYYLAWLAWKLARQFKIGLEIQVHGFEKFFGWRKMIAKFVIPRADAIRVVSQRLKKQMIDDFGVKEEKIKVVPLYVERISHIAYRTSPDGKFIFLTVSRLVPVKNIEMQIRAFKNLELRFKNIELWIAGEGELREKLEVETHNHASVRFFGWQNDLGKFYSQADAFLLTSNYEGWGMVIIEAASFGLPIIMTDVGCAGEVIKDGESGIVIPVGGQKELEAAMRKIIEDEDLRQKLGEGAKKAVEELPSRGETLKLYLESWRKACGNF